MRQLLTGLFSIFILIVLGVFGPGSASAALSVYTTQSGFLTAIGSGYNQQTLNLDGMTAGALIASGVSVGGITFTYNIQDSTQSYTMQVENTYGTTSPPNYLGLNSNDGAFVHGDSFSMSFGGTINAVGLYIITGTNVVVDANDFRLNIASGYGSNGLYDRTVSPGDPSLAGYAYFLGIVDNAGFSSVDFLSNGAYGYEFNIDDITTAKQSAVPDPSPFLLLATGLIGLGGFKLWKRACKAC